MASGGAEDEGRGRAEMTSGREVTEGNEGDEKHSSGVVNVVCREAEVTNGGAEVTNGGAEVTSMETEDEEASNGFSRDSWEAGEPRWGAATFGWVVTTDV